MSKYFCLISLLFCFLQATAEDVTDVTTTNGNNRTKYLDTIVIGEIDPENVTGFSANLAFELTTPGGSQGRWTTGGGATLTVLYTRQLYSHMFASGGIAGYYSTIGTDFIPESTVITDASIKNWGIRIPLHIGMVVPTTPELNLTMSTGPQLNVNLYAHEQLPPDFSQTVPKPGESINLFGRGFHRLDLQWGFWVGLTYLKHYTIGLQGGIGLSPEASMKYGRRTLHIRRNNIALVLSYTF